jgi:uncharacterized iron-regulated protein
MSQAFELHRICTGNRPLKALAMALFLAIWPAGTEAQQTTAEWDGLAAHPLNGTIWTAEGEELTDKDLSDLIAQAKYILIGEIHDNAQHHQNQAKWLGAAVGTGEKPAVIFEMIPRSMQGQVDTFLSSSTATAETFGNTVDWEERGWPAWSLYQPIMDVIIENELPVIAGGVDRDLVMEIGQNGASVLKTQKRTAWGLDEALPAALRDDLLTELEQSHCGLMPKAALTGMIPVQRARDGSLAEAMFEGANEHGKAVMIAGNGHVRKDRGAPLILRALDSENDSLVIGQIQVRDGTNEFADYRSADLPPPYDVVIFTSANPPVDHCEKLREQLGKASPSNDR